MTDNYDPKLIMADKHIGDAIRSSYYTGDAKGHLAVLKISLSRAWFTLQEFTDAYVDIFTEQFQLWLGEEKGRSTGRFVSFVFALAVFAVIVAAAY